MRRRCVLALPLLLVCCAPEGDKTTPPAPSGAPVEPKDFVLRTNANGETSVHSPDGRVLAVLTEGARTVTFMGPERTFTEVGSKTITVRTREWVRLAPAAWQPDGAGKPWFGDFMGRYVGASDADVLAVAMQYVRGAPDLRDEGGTAYAGDAGFGLSRDDGVDGADFNDYLGIPWTYPGGRVQEADVKWYRKLDCSGYLRLVFGYRGGMTLQWSADNAIGLPRTANAMATAGPGVLIAAGTTSADAPVDLGRVRPGDLVFFALRSDTQISHSGIYLGRDDKGRMRFLSSRSGPDGPTMEDSKSGGSLDAGIFRERLRRVIRL